ncbi:MAG: hypothetical protein IKF14_10525 [Atopobiaceae bacterium]|nr:hypothetical protein [Atopobiaceae bacterium]
MNWAKSYAASFTLNPVDTLTWADIGAVPLATAIITRTADGDAPELESATLECIGDFEPGYHRVVMIAEQDGETERVEVATLWVGRSSETVDHGFERQSLDGRSVLIPAELAVVARGEFAAKGADGAAKAASMLADCLHAPVSVEGSFRLDDHFDFEPESTVLEAVWSLLHAGGFCMQVDGHGTVHIRPIPTEPAFLANADNAGIIQPGVTRSTSNALPVNRYIAVEGEQVAVAENHTGTGRFERFGIWVDHYDTAPVRTDGESLERYAYRRGVEEGTVEETWGYDRRYVPGVYPFDIIRGTLPDMMGDMRVKTQTITAGHGLMVAETACREVDTW